ncbi:MAG: hypothetical protein VX916_07145 [Planctomycetota bacterium]|nr:hypothetical protein [Planctomycetota bacterium]
MADRSPYQKGVIRRYYEHRDDIAVQKLGEIVSNLYLETKPGTSSSAWGAAEKHLLACGVHPNEVKGVVDDRDLGALAKLVGRLF